MSDELECGNCGARSPEESGCPRCGGPMFRAESAGGRAELASYRRLRRTTHGVMPRLVRALLWVKLTLLVLSAAFVFGLGDLIEACWESSATEAQFELYCLGIAVGIAGLGGALHAFVRWLARRSGASDDPARGAVTPA